VIFGEVPYRNPNFTGRDELLAIEYAYRYATEYDLV
jgi:hypothetical protein